MLRNISQLQQTNINIYSYILFYTQTRINKIYTHEFKIKIKTYWNGKIIMINSFFLSMYTFCIAMKIKHAFIVNCLYRM